MSDGSPVGVLLIQLGTPKSPEKGDVRRYLRQFLSDPRVMDVPAPIRALLLHAVILPFRPRRSAHAYRQIWTEEGSPLTLHTQALAEAVGDRLGDGYRVAVGMRYQEPSLKGALGDLTGAGCRRLVILPLFPQYSSAASGSALEAAVGEAIREWNVPDVVTVGDFYGDEGFLDALVATSRSHLERFRPDHVLFSYHGLPETQIRRGDPSGQWCLRSDACCDMVGAVNRFCYRAQSVATSRMASARLGLAPLTYSTSFQSRLAGQKWIEPYTDVVLSELYAAGVRRLAVLTPSFTADCLETLEEIGIRARASWEELGGDDFLLVPCLNSAPPWADAVAGMVRRMS